MSSLSSAYRQSSVDKENPVLGGYGSTKKSGHVTHDPAKLCIHGLDVNRLHQPEQSIRQLGSTPVRPMTSMATGENLVKQQQSASNEASISLKQRRALGDVINTTTSQTRQSNGHGFVNTPKTNSNLANKSLRPTSSVCLGVSGAGESNELPPIESFPVPYPDTFNDLFNEGRLSELLMPSSPGLNFKYIPSLPSSTLCNAQDSFYSSRGALSDAEWRRHLKIMNKSCKRRTTTSMGVSSSSECIGIYRDEPFIEKVELDF
jgi:hypothetical protein